MGLSLHRGHVVEDLEGGLFTGDFESRKSALCKRSVPPYGSSATGTWGMAPLLGTLKAT